MVIPSLSLSLSLSLFLFLSLSLSLSLFIRSIPVFHTIPLFIYFSSFSFSLTQKLLFFSSSFFVQVHFYIICNNYGTTTTTTLIATTTTTSPNIATTTTTAEKGSGGTFQDHRFWFSLVCQPFIRRLLPFELNRVRVESVRRQVLQQCGREPKNWVEIRHWLPNFRPVKCSRPRTGTGFLLCCVVSLVRVVVKSNSVFWINEIFIRIKSNAELELRFLSHDRTNSILSITVYPRFDLKIWLDCWCFVFRSHFHVPFHWQTLLDRSGVCWNWMWCVMFSLFNTQFCGFWVWLFRRRSGPNIYSILHTIKGSANRFDLARNNNVM